MTVTDQPDLMSHDTMAPPVYGDPSSFPSHAEHVRTRPLASLADLRPAVVDLAHRAKRWAGGSV